jgi:hypothetical protein
MEWFSDLGIEASPEETTALRRHTCADASTMSIPNSREQGAHDGSAMPRRITDSSACVWPVKCGVVFLDIVEIDGAERRRRLL